MKAILSDSEIDTLDTKFAKLYSNWCSDSSTIASRNYSRGYVNGMLYVLRVLGFSVVEDRSNRWSFHIERN